MTTTTQQVAVDAVTEVLLSAIRYVEGEASFKAFNERSQSDEQSLLLRLRALLATRPASTVNAGAVERQRGKYDNVLEPFMALMEKELHANSGKGDRPGWLSMPTSTATLEIYYHVA